MTWHWACGPPAVWIQTATQLAQALLFTPSTKNLYYHSGPDYRYVADAFLTEQYMWKN